MKRIAGMLLGLVAHYLVRRLACDDAWPLLYKPYSGATLLSFA